jgi:hypothetical protein
MIFFQKAKVHNMLIMVLNCCYKGLGLVIHFVGKERLRLEITNEYDY